MPVSTASGPAPELTDGIVTLRAHTAHDVDAIVAQCLDPESRRWTTVPRSYSRDDALSFVESNRAAWQEKGGTRSWAITWSDPSDSSAPTSSSGQPRFAGTIDLRPGAAVTVGELGFGLHPDARGHGLMARAVRLVCEHAFASAAGASR